MGPGRVLVTRGGRMESAHEVDVAVCDASGSLRASAGDASREAFARSAVKPFQALPLVEDGVVERFGLTTDELALCCASHSGDDRHVAAARSILERIGLEPEDLACGPHAPFDRDAARTLNREGTEPTRLHNNCSGKHAGMLALARAHGWPTDGYHELDHPVQQRMLDVVSHWTGLPRAGIATGVDGCGVATFAMPLSALAVALARLAGAAAAAADSPAGNVLLAMASHPRMVGGNGRLCTRVIEATGGRVVAKVGAEGMYGVAVPSRSLGVALKVRDGARRAAEVMLIEVLARLGLLRPDDAAGLERWSRPEILNTRGESVGTMRCELELEDLNG